MDEPEDLNWIARLQFRALRSLWRRVEASPRFQETRRRHRLAEPVVITARAFAYGPDDDEALAARLRRHVKNLEAAKYALEELEQDRDEYDGDRAYRALYAVVNGGPVPPKALRTDS